MQNIFKKKSVDANAPGMAKAIPQPQHQPHQPPTPSPNTSKTSSPTASTTSIAAATTALSTTSESKDREIDGLLLVRVVEARNLVFPANALVDIANSANAQERLPQDEKKMPYCVVEFDKNQIMTGVREMKIGTNQGQHSLQWKHRAHFDVSRVMDVQITVYAKDVAGGKDVGIGRLVISPNFSDQSIQEGWFPLLQINDQEVKVGEVSIQIGFKKNGSDTKSLSMEAFELLKVIGKGSFGKVMQVRKKDTGRIYAMKIIKKAHIVSRSEVSHTLAERNVLAKLNHPFITPLKYSFQTPEKLYLVLAFVNGGELFFHLQKEGKFGEDRARFYTAELLCALECLHYHNIIYRDLKPENILLDYTGHIALCDFGLCKLNMKEGKKTNTFCGTPEYLAPELLLSKGYTKSVDWWTLGILLFEMLTGLPPFYDENTNEMYKKIVNDELVIPDEISKNARDLLEKLLERDPNKRLGANGPEEIKNHVFFSDLVWSKLMSKKYIPPFKPDVADAHDTSNFDEEFTQEKPEDSYQGKSELSQTCQQQFQGFSYQNNEMSFVAGSVLDSKPKLREMGASRVGQKK